MATTVPITLAGKERSLKFDFNALADLDTAAPGVLPGYISGLQAGFGAVRALIWAGLKHEEPRLKLTEAGALIEAELLSGEKTLLDFLNLLNDALVASGLFSKKDAAANGHDAPAPPFFHKTDSQDGSPN